MNSVFPDWQKYAVHQRRSLSGCIPTAYEMILRSVNAKYINFKSFQDDFDLDKNLRQGEIPKNDFKSVANAIFQKYPTVCFSQVVFDKGKGADKLAFVEKQLVCKQPVIVSIANEPFGRKGWHIMPIVDATTEDLTLLEIVDINGIPKTLILNKVEFVQIHNCYDGGKDVAFLESW